MFEEPVADDATPEQQQHRVDAVVARGPVGAFALAGIALAIVMAIWLAFYVFVFLAREGA
jgi:asparagine N-glycosylation enzyme membrane subunit Stt3